MARYIDADKVMEEIASMGGHDLCEWSTLGVKALIDRQPTADVVPRTDVDLYRGQVDELEDELAITYNRLEDARREMGSEIFKELERTPVFADYDTDGERILCFYAQEYDELKKKYTEAGDDQSNT